MPDYCGNTLIVRGAAHRLGEFVKTAKGFCGDMETVLDFNRFVPYPEHFIEQDRQAAELTSRIRDLPEAARELALALEDGYPTDGYNDGGYEWCVENWGTKWNALDAELEEDEDELRYRFSTAWCPPLKVIEAMAEAFPDLHLSLEYRQEGEGNVGYAEYNEGGLQSLEEKTLEGGANE